RGASWRRRQKRSHPVAVDALPLAGSLEGSVSGLDLSFEELPIGGVALDLVGIPLSEETLTKAKNSDVVLLGAIGWYKLITVFPQVSHTDISLFLEWLMECVQLCLFLDILELWTCLSWLIRLMIIRELTRGQ
ncbi:hypothetical protein DY000_02008716, partial [Brassica cretica]